MKEIKFKATLKGKLVAYIRISPDEDGNLHTSWNTTNNAGWILTAPPTHDHLNQCVGIKDKNGKEIYAGDIIKLSDAANLQEVIATGSRISLRSLPDNDDFEDLYKIPACDMEIVGSIMEQNGPKPKFGTVWEIFYGSLRN